MDREKRPDEKFCHECGEIIRAKAEICPKCGVRQPLICQGPIIGNILGQGQPRSRVVAGMIGILGGGLGLHKFYMGQPSWGIAYVVLCWTVIPAILGFIEGLNFLTMSEEIFQKRHSGPSWSSQ